MSTELEIQQLVEPRPNRFTLRESQDSAIAEQKKRLNLSRHSKKNKPKSSKILAR